MSKKELKLFFLYLFIYIIWPKEREEKNACVCVGARSYSLEKGERE
jgi:hypothetical protein